MFQPRLRRLAVVDLQQAAEAFAALDRAVARRGRVRLHRPAVLQALVRTLKVMVLDILLEDVADLTLAEEDDLVQALSLRCPYPRLAEGIQVRTTAGHLEAPHAGHPERLLELLGEQRVAVVDQDSLALEEAVLGVGEVGDSFNPSSRQLPGRSAGSRALPSARENRPGPSSWIRPRRASPYRKPRRLSRLVRSWAMRRTSHRS